jgi:hypothetical protein
MMSFSSVSVSGFFPYSLSSKSTFVDCKKLLALRQLLHAPL